MRLREFAPSPERDDNDDVPDPIFVLANRWWNAAEKQPQIEHVLNSLGWSIHQVESEDDAVQLQHRDGTTYFISADDFDPDLFEYQKPKIQRANRDGIDLSFEKVKDDEYVDDDDDENIVAQVTATSNGKELGHVLFSIDGDTLLPQDLEVDERYRGQGIAKIMYDYVKSLGYQIRRSGQQTDAGAGFWGKHRPGVNVWETELDKSQRRQHLDFDSLYGKAFKITDHSGNPNTPGFSIVTPLNGDSWNWRERPEFKAIVKRKLNQPGWLGDHKYQQIIDYMAGNKFDPAKHLVKEIARIPQSELGGWGDKDTLEPMTKPPKNRKPLPGGSGLTYAVNKKDPEFLEIMIFDGNTLAAELDLFATLDPLKTWRVETVITDPDYRGRGMGKALYGIALSILKLTIEAGEQQTKFGQAMWLMLDSIPGVEVKGYNMVPTDKYQPNKNDTIVKQDADWTRYTFPVESGTRSMRSARRGTGLYNSQATMIAKWTGR
jgi:GNAT superfamily N-acetyltransferase